VHCHERLLLVTSRCLVRVCCEWIFSCVSCVHTTSCYVCLRTPLKVLTPRLWVATPCCPTDSVRCCSTVPGTRGLCGNWRVWLSEQLWAHRLDLSPSTHCRCPPTSNNICYTMSLNAGTRRRNWTEVKCMNRQGLNFEEIMTVGKQDEPIGDWLTLTWA